MSARAADPHSNLRAADAAAARLLQEIDDLERRLARIAASDDAQRTYLVHAYRRDIESRHRLLAELPEPIERVPDPWR